MADTSGQTEEPTQKKLDKARKEGQFPVSKEFVNGVQFLIFVWLLGSYGSKWLAGLVATSRIIFNRGFRVELTPETLLNNISILGIDPGSQIIDRFGRPHRLNAGEIIAPLYS